MGEKLRRFRYKLKYNNTPERSIGIAVMFLVLFWEISAMFTHNNRHVNIAMCLNCFLAILYCTPPIKSLRNKGRRFIAVDYGLISHIAVINQRSFPRLEDIDCPNRGFKEEFVDIMKNLKPGYEYRMITHAKTIHYIKKFWPDCFTEPVFVSTKELDHVKAKIRIPKCTNCDRKDSCGTMSESTPDASSFYGVIIRIG